MTRHSLACAVIAAVTLAIIAFFTLNNRAPAQSDAARVPWTTSKIHGSPEPPPPYRLERVFSSLQFKGLTHMSPAPGTRRLFVTTEKGAISSFLPDEATKKADSFLNVKNSFQLNSIVFHPKFQENRLCFVFYVTGTRDTGTARISRFKVKDGDPPQADAASETVLLEWKCEPGGQHNGGGMCFGPDGYLYFSAGDSGQATPPDKFNTGQNINDIPASIVRIDVDHEQNGKPYSIPSDNPFVKTPGARGEIWAYGCRNPWKISFDRKTGDLWAGDVGWELWEMVYRVVKGGNYGWSIQEGPQPVHPNTKPGPTPILPHAIDIPHSDAASITGGYVYRGKKLANLVGTYVYGDYMTSKLWSATIAGDRFTANKEIAQSHIRVVAFGEDNDGELYVLAYNKDGPEGIYQLVANAQEPNAAPFPRKISETGLFSSAKDATLSPGVLPYTVNASMWMDHGMSERLVGLPDLSSVRITDNRQQFPGMVDFIRTRIFLPKDGVLVKTISMEMEQGKPASKRRLETQILHYDGTEIRPYTYRWNEAQTDAELVPPSGADMELDIVDADSPGGHRKQTWRFAGRAQCMQCHNYWAGPVLGFTPEELDRQGQLDRFQKIAVVNSGGGGGGKGGAKGGGGGKVKVLFTTVDPYDDKADLTKRARSYLNTNCAHCHQNGAGGGGTTDLRAETGANNMRALDVAPNHGTFDIANGKIIASGDPYASVAYYRMAKTGAGHMPHIGSEVVDVAGVNLMNQWIVSLPAKGGGAPNARLLTLLEKVASESPDNIDNATNALLSSTSGALIVAHAIDAKKFDVALQKRMIAAAAAKPDSQIRDLFERFLPAEQRVKRLGPNIRPEMLLAMKGDPVLGKQVFFKTAGVQCAICHKIGSEGGNLGPDLSQIGKKYDRAKILENILDPSKEIDPAYVTYTAQISDGRIIVGLVASKSEKEVVMRNLQGEVKEIHIPNADLEALTASRQSLMPDQQLRDLTAQQAAGLVEYLATLKGE